MAEYNKIDGFVFDEQTIQGWGKTLKMSGKAPAVAKRIFDTLEHAQEYVDDPNDSAIEGLLLSVIDDEKNNGVYFVESVGTVAIDGNGIKNGVLVKVNSDDIEQIEGIIDEKIQEANTPLQEADATLRENINEIGDALDTTKEEINNTIVEISERINSYCINGKLISENPTLNSDDIQISDNYTTLQEVNNNVSPGDFLTTAISKIEIMLANTTLALTAALNDLESKIGKPVEYDDEGEIVANATGVYAKLDEIVSEVNNKISSIENDVLPNIANDVDDKITANTTGIYAKLDEIVSEVNDRISSIEDDTLPGITNDVDDKISILESKIGNPSGSDENGDITESTGIYAKLDEIVGEVNEVDIKIEKANSKIDVTNNIDKKIIANALVDLDDRVNALETKIKGA